MDNLLFLLALAATAVEMTACFICARNLIKLQSEDWDRSRRMLTIGAIFSGVMALFVILGNIISTVQDDIQKDRFCVVVGTATFDDEAPDASTCYGATQIVVSVFEDPEMNRTRHNSPTFLSAAQAIAKSLKLFRPDVHGAGHLTSPRIGKAQDLGDGVIAVDVTLSMKIEL